FRPKLTGRDGRTGKRVQPAIIAVDAERLDMELDVRPVGGKARAGEASGERGAEAEHAPPAQDVVEADEELAQGTACQVVETDRPVEPEHQPRLQMVLQ